MQKLMMTVMLLLLCSAKCNRPSMSDIARFNNRPILSLHCIANGDGTCTEISDEHEHVEVVNKICGDAVDFGEIKSHIERLELFRYKCLKHGKCIE